MDTQDTSFGAPPSGLPPLAWLSGLSLGQVGLGGQQDGSLSGAGRFAEGVGAPGAEGLGLDALAQMFATMQGGDVASAASDSPIGTGTLAQGGGTLGQANAGPTGGYAVAGQTAGAGAQQAAEGQAAGSMDPLAIIQKILGVAQKGLGGALGAGGGQGGTVGGGGYLSTGQQQPSPLGFPASGYSLAGPQEGNPLAGIAQDQQGAFLGTNVLQDPTFGPLLTQGLLTGSLTPADLSNLSTLGQDQIAGLRTALLGGDVQSDLGSQLLSGQGGTQGFTLGAGTASPTNWGGVAQGGLAGALGLLNVLQSAQGGNVAQGVGGGLQGLG